jgi:hypothetical protein
MTCGPIFPEACLLAGTQCLCAGCLRKRLTSHLFLTPEHRVGLLLEGTRR